MVHSNKTRELLKKNSRGELLEPRQQLRELPAENSHKTDPLRGSTSTANPPRFSRKNSGPPQLFLPETGLRIFHAQGREV